MVKRMRSKSNKRVKSKNRSREGYYRIIEYGYDPQNYAYDDSYKDIWWNPKKILHRIRQ